MQTTYTKMSIFARCCSTLLKKPLISTNIVRNVRTSSKHTVKDTKRRAIQKEPMKTTEVMPGQHRPQHRLYVITDPHSQMDLLSLSGPDLRAHQDDTFVALPALSPAMTSGAIFMWQKSEGDFLLPDDVLAEILTDDRKTVNFVAPVAGYLAKIVVPTGELNVPVDCLMCIIVKHKSHVVLYQRNFIDFYKILRRSTLIHFEESQKLKQIQNGRGYPITTSNIYIEYIEK